MERESATIQALRSDLALQIARFLEREELSQIAAARRLSIPQPTVSKIVNGKVFELSLELLIRVAVRAGLPVVLQTGKVPAEAGVFLSGGPARQRTAPGRRRSAVAEATRDALLETGRQLTPEQRLQTHLEHNALVTELHRAALTARGGNRTARRRRSP